MKILNEIRKKTKEIIVECIYSHPEKPEKFDENEGNFFIVLSCASQGPLPWLSFLFFTLAILEKGKYHFSKRDCSTEERWKLGGKFLLY